jgi:hypothetical protein
MKVKLFILLAMLATSLQAQNDPDYEKTPILVSNSVFRHQQCLGVNWQILSH